MATVIQIKRSTGSSAPATSNLAEGELAYVQDRANSGAGAKLYIESVDSDNSTQLIHAIGGKYYTDMLAGSTATPANFKVGNSATAGASIQLLEDSDNGTNYVALKAADTLGSSVTWTLPSADGSANQVLATNGSGTLSFASTTSTVAGATDTNLTTPADGSMMLYDTGTSKWIDNVMSGDATMTDGGVITIANDAVEQAMIADDAVGADQLAASSVVFGSLAGALVQTSGESFSDDDTSIMTSAAILDKIQATATLEDLDIAGDSGTGAIDLDSETLTIAGTANEIETSMSGNTLTVGMPNNVTVGGNLTVSGNMVTDDITTATLTTSGNLTVTGNLSVNGTTTTVNSTTVNIADPVFEIGSDSSDDNLDRGIKFKYNDSGAKLGFFGMDDSTGKFVALKAATDSSSVFSGTAMPAVFGAMEISSLAMSGSISNYAGSAPTDGQVLIGDTSGGVFDAATLTAGDGIDITNGAGAITIATEVGTASNLGSVIIAVGEGMDVAYSGGTATLSGEDATTSNKGIASFASANFTVSSGAVSITALDGGTF
tara:strand:+ start:2403 stop:4043 length:1641 start_codon:yes stop_codon:yes gene_type:complete